MYSLKFFVDMLRHKNIPLKDLSRVQRVCDVFISRSTNDGFPKDYLLFLKRPSLLSH